MQAEPPVPDGWSLALLVGCMVTARTAAMGMNRVADAEIDARNPRTAGRAIPAGRLSRGVAVALTLFSAAAFLGLAWLFLPLRRNVWPGVLAPPVLAVLLGYSWTKRWTALSHWVLGLCLGLAPVAAWVALRGSLGPLPVLVGAAVLFWTAGFDIHYAFQDVEADRRDGLRSMPASLGRRRAHVVAAGCHAVTLVLLAAAAMTDRRDDMRGRIGLGSLLALGVIAWELVRHHVRAHRASDEELAAAFFPVNARVSMMWLAGTALDVVAGLEVLA